MQPSRITVVIPLFNKASHIRRAVESVLNQSIQEFEIVVVDDGSTDGGAEAVRGIHDARIHLVRQPNRGAAGARNRGIAEARHGLIAFLDADDTYNPNFLEVIVDLAARHESAGAYGTSFEIVRPDRRRTVWRTSALRESKANEIVIRDFFRHAMAGPVLGSSATAVLKSTFAAVGGFPEGVRLGEDLDLWMRIGARYPIAVSRYVGAVYRQDAVNRTDFGRTQDEEYELVKTGLRLLESGTLERRVRKQLREYVSMYQIMTADHLVRLGQRARARRMLLESRTTKFLGRKIWWLFWTLVPTPATLAAIRAKRRLFSFARIGG